MREFLFVGVTNWRLIIIVFSYGVMLLNLQDGILRYKMSHKIAINTHSIHDSFFVRSASANSS